jgi:hypothetical protein
MPSIYCEMPNECKLPRGHLAQFATPEGDRVCAAVLGPLGLNEDECKPLQQLNGATIEKPGERVTRVKQRSVAEPSEKKARLCACGCGSTLKPEAIHKYLRGHKTAARIAKADAFPIRKKREKRSLEAAQKKKAAPQIEEQSQPIGETISEPVAVTPPPPSRAELAAEAAVTRWWLALSLDERSRIYLLQTAG